MSATGAAKLLGMRWRTVALLAVGAGLAALIAANVHLVYVAVQSQPDCVPHTKSAGEPGTFRAARSAC
jgi:hypothetical protein